MNNLVFSRTAFTVQYRLSFFLFFFFKLSITFLSHIVSYCMTRHD